jgi:ketosteroid isomerase-like protein
MAFSGNKEFDNLQLRVLVDERVNAIRNLDTDKLMLAYTPDVSSLDVVNPMFHEGNASIRKFNGSLKVAHEHNPVPFNMDDGKASPDLEPW